MIIPNIISNAGLPIRVNKLMIELSRQNIAVYKLWPSIQAPPDKPRRYAISKAHKQIIEWALLEGLPEVTVFEDDIWFPAEDGWQYYQDNKPKEFDLYLGGVYRGEIDENNKIKRFTGMMCYTISEKFYTTFLGVNEMLDIDGAMSGLGDFYVCNPFAAICHDGWSENVGGMMAYNHLLKGREVRGIGIM